ncbi:MAG: hypothetical protein ACLQGP_08060 [Isosphaeraceae bacterium]
MAEEIGSTSTTPASISQSPAPTLSSATATTQQTVTIPLEQVQAFTAMQSRLSQLEGEQRSREQSTQQEQARILAQKGEVENALRILREQSEQQVQTERARLTQVEERAKRYALDGELSRALAACNLVPGGAEQLTQLWRNQFLVDAQGDSFAVRTPTFQSVGDFVHQQLARPEYAHFVRAQNPGGGTGGLQPSAQTLPSATANPSQMPQPKNMGEAVILHMQNMQKAQGDPRSNISLPMGLKAVR